jgi:hypothetical protein
MISRYSVIASVCFGLIGGNAEAGCFGKRVNQCQSAPVYCAPAVCNSQCAVQYYSAPSPPGSISNSGMCRSGPAHEGPAFPGVSAMAPLGIDSFGNVVTSVGVPTTVSNIVVGGGPVSSDSFDVQRFLKDLLTDRLLTPPGVNKAAVTTGTISQEQLNQILAPYRPSQN